MNDYYIVGLGNPEPEYNGTRHNAGRFFVRLFQEKHGFDEFKPAKNLALVSEGKINKKRVFLILPENYMNNSGRALAAFVKPKKTLENLIVLNDDIDLPLGKFKITFNRGSGGHKGVESIKRVMKTEAFARLRIGISPKKKPNHKELMKFLIARFKPSENAALKKISKKVTEALETIITEGREKAMSMHN